MLSGDAAAGSSGVFRDEMERVGHGPDPTRRSITTYFRHGFAAPTGILRSNLVLRVVRDDGVVVYLNGIEVFRDNLPVGAVSFATLASNALALNENHPVAGAVDAALLRSGTNVVAVEIHQADLESSDLSFDLELTGAAAGELAPVGIRREGAELVLSWTDTGAQLEQADTVSGPWRPVPDLVGTAYRIVPAATAQFYRLRR